ncbi:hypothetical protein PT274_01665 [Leuconostocaceae bacterium ESL0958]|nr:hypothetical protein [Leuconostocaceae bacterium ESL0958]
MAFYRFTNRLINVVLSILLVITLMGAIALIPENIQGVSNHFVKFVDYLLVLVLLLLAVRHFMPGYWQKSKTYLSNWATSSKFWIVIFFLLLLWQLSCIWLLSGTSTWDWMFLAKQAYTAHPGWPWPDYGSNSPNNLLLLKLERIYYDGLGRPDFKTFMFALNIANTVLVDGATWMIWRFAKKINQPKVASATLVMTLVIFTLVPFFVIPYSDTVSFFLCTLLLTSFLALIKPHRLVTKISIALLIGCQLTVAYFIKPSLIIIFLAVIAVMLVLLLSGQYKKRKLAGVFLLLGVVLGTFVLTQPLTKNYLYYHNGIVKVDPSEAFPMTHFMAMGITGDGDFSGVDRLRSIAIKDPKERNQDAINRIKERFEAQGRWMGYQRFLVHKQIKNSADGTFGWGHEIYYLKVFDHQNHYLNQMPQRKLFVDPDGIAREDRFSFRLVQQVLWVMIIVFMLFSVFDQSMLTLFLKMTAIGFFAFLLLFEGGRSRYLIQFLPVLLLLAGIGFQKFCQCYHWYRTGKLQDSKTAMLGNYEK